MLENAPVPYMSAFQPPRTDITPIFFFLLLPPPPRSTLFPYTTLFRSDQIYAEAIAIEPTENLWLDTPALVAAHDSVTSEAKARSEEHTSELQSQSNLVCRLLLEKKKKNKTTPCFPTNRSRCSRQHRPA